jgi:hypothetical protein
MTLTMLFVNDEDDEKETTDERREKCQVSALASNESSDSRHVFSSHLERSWVKTSSLKTQLDRIHTHELGEDFCSNLNPPP